MSFSIFVYHILPCNPLWGLGDFVMRPAYVEMCLVCLVCSREHSFGLSTQALPIHFVFLRVVRYRGRKGNGRKSGNHYIVVLKVLQEGQP